MGRRRSFRCITDETCFCPCPLCCKISEIDWQDPGDLAYPGSSPATVVWNHIDNGCPTQTPFLQSSYVLSVIEGSPTEFEVVFYCDDYAGAGDVLAVTVISSDVTWQEVTISGTTYRRPNGTAVLRIDSDQRPGVACRLSIEFDADYRVAPASPGRALAKLRVA